MSNFKTELAAIKLEKIIKALSSQYKHDCIRTCREGAQPELSKVECSTQTFNRDQAAFARMELIRRLFEKFDLDIIENPSTKPLINNHYKKEWRR